MVIEAAKSNKNSYSGIRKIEFRQDPRIGRPDTVSLDKFERSSRKEEIKYEKLQLRKIRKQQSENPVNPEPQTPVDPAKPVIPDTEVRSYAEKYVALYEKNSGITLTQEQRSEKIQSVSEFYSSPQRVNRLETLVDSLSIAA